MKRRKSKKIKKVEEPKVSFKHFFDQAKQKDLTRRWSEREIELYFTSCGLEEKETWETFIKTLKTY